MINNYLTELKEWEDYLAGYGNNVSLLGEEVLDLEEKREEAAKARNIKKALYYVAVEADKCEEIIEALHGMYVPKIAKNYHAYGTKAYIKWRQILIRILKSSCELAAGTPGYDETKAQNLADERGHLVALANQEAERIVRYLNQKAKELDLTVPFPD